VENTLHVSAKQIDNINIVNLTYRDSR